MSSLQIGEDKYKVTVNHEGTTIAECSKTKNGFRIIFEFTKNKDEHEETIKAMKRLYKSII